MQELCTGDIKTRSTLLISCRRHLRFFWRPLTIRKMFNILHCLGEMALRRSHLHSMPFYLRVEISACCNLRCPGCTLIQQAQNNPDQKSSNKLMNYTTFRQSIQDFLPYLLKVNLFDEGEPLLNQDLYQIIRYLNQQKISTCISTNFSLNLSDEEISALVTSGLDHLVISIDGSTQQTYGQYRIGGDLNLVLDNLDKILSTRRRLHRRSPFVEMQYIDFDNNPQERQNMKQVARQYQVDRLTIVQGSSRRGWAGTRFRGTEPQRRRKGCFHTWVSTTINVDGQVGPCDYGEDHGMPYLGPACRYQDQNLRNHKHLLNLRHSFQAKNNSHLDPVCRHCSLYMC